MTQKPEGKPYLCDQISNQNLSELSSRHSPLWNYNPDTLSTQTILGYIWITIAVIGFMLNIAQIWWVLSRGKKTVIDVFIVSLAVVDLQVCCMNIPFQVSELFNNFDWSYLGSYSQLACTAHWVFRYGSVVSSSIMMSLIAVSRYIAVSHPLRRLKEKYSSMCVNSTLAVLAWIVTVALVVPVVSVTAEVNTKYILTNHTPPTDAHILDNNQTSLYCVKKVQICEQSEVSTGPVIYGSILFFIAPLLIMSASYASVIRILVEKKKLYEHIGLRKSRPDKRKGFQKSIVNSGLGLAYILLVAPKGVYDIIKIAKYNRAEDKTTPQENDIADLVLYAIATMIVISNPVIYSFLTPRFAKFVEQHSQHSNLSNFSSRNPLNKMGSLFSLLSNIDSKPTKRLSVRRYSVPSLFEQRQRVTKTKIMEAPLLETCLEMSPEKICFEQKIEMYPKITEDLPIFRRISTTGKNLNEAGARTLGQYATL